MNNTDMIEDAEFVKVEFIDETEQVINYVDEDGICEDVTIEIIDVTEL